jgi:hypothetical protein
VYRKVILERCERKKQTVKERKKTEGPEKDKYIVDYMASHPSNGNLQA